MKQETTSALHLLPTPLNKCRCYLTLTRTESRTDPKLVYPTKSSTVDAVEANATLRDLQLISFKVKKKHLVGRMQKYDVTYVPTYYHKLHDTGQCPEVP
jgi:hypothetical protein